MAEPRVIDAHTHAFSPELVADRHLTCRRDRWFGDLYQNPAAHLTTAEELLASMQAAGIAHSVICGFPWSDAGRCREQNAYFADVASKSEGRLSWLAAVSPLDPHADTDAADALGCGAVGIGELNADAQGFDLKCPGQIQSLAETCMSYERPMMLHTSEPLGHLYLGKGTAAPDRLLTFVSAFPELIVIAAHWGGGLPFYELMPEVAEATRNVVYDSAASTYLYRFEVFRTVIDLVGADRVMFASDYPVLRQDRFRQRVINVPMNAAEREAVMFSTAARIFGVDLARFADIAGAEAR